MEWYIPLGGHYDRVYISKVFSDAYTKDYLFPIDADEIIRGGSGYAISNVDGNEVYDKSKDEPLPAEIEHCFPDYSLYEAYGIHDTAYGFMTRGCPRGCPFCHVKYMQGTKVKRHSPLNEFWNGQKKIVLLDPNITASKQYFEIMKELAETKAVVDFSQGLDVRLMTPEKVHALNEVRWQRIHFAWDRPEDDLREKLRMMIENIKIPAKNARSKITVYVLCNFNSTYEQDVQRVEYIKSINLQPFVMIYDKPSASKEVRRLASYANNPYVCWSMASVDEYDTKKRSGVNNIGKPEAEDGYDDLAAKGG